MKKLKQRKKMKAMKKLKVNKIAKNAIAQLKIKYNWKIIILMKI